MPRAAKPPSIKKGKDMKKTVKKFFEAITSPFIALAVNIAESREINEDGSWDKYWECKNRKAERKARAGKGER